MIHHLSGQKKLHFALGALVVLMMVIIIFSQLAMEIYAYSFIATQNMNSVQVERQIALRQKEAQSMENKKQQKETLEDKGNKLTGTGSEKKQSAVQVSGITPVVSFIMPVKNGITTSIFGDTVSRNATHLGHDWAVSVGTKVRASADGVVVAAYYSESYGYNVLLYHGDGIETRYAHLSKLKVEKGQAVSQNQIIGLSGNTGDSTGPHLHFEVIKNGTHINPLEMIGK